MIVCYEDFNSMPASGHNVIYNYYVEPVGTGDLISFHFISFHYYTRTPLSHNTVCAQTVRGRNFRGFRGSGAHPRII